MSSSFEGSATGSTWERIHLRLEAVRAVLDKAFAPGPEVQRRILRARASVLGRELQTGSEAVERIEILEFRLANEVYAIELPYIFEVCQLKELRPLPCVPSFVLGLITLRGKVVTVIDIRRFFDLPQQGLSEMSKVVVVQARGLKVGILADAVGTIRTIGLQDLQPGLSTLIGIRAEYLRGLTAESTVILAADTLLGASRILVDEG